MSKGNNNWWMINTILLIIILFILLSRCNKNNFYYGDVFTIDFDKSDDCKLDKNDGDIIIEDKNGNYLFQKKLEIFDNSFLDNKIAPGISSVYFFRINNNSNVNIKYDLKLNNASSYDINMKYRLKRNGKYILGNEWMNAFSIKTSFLELDSGKSDMYELEWKWFDNDEVDSYIGENIINDYFLNIIFSLVQL